MTLRRAACIVCMPPEVVYTPKQRCREAATLHGARQTFMPLRQEQHHFVHYASSSFSLLGAAHYPVEMDADALEPRIGMTSCCAKRCAKHKHEGHPAQSAYVRRIKLRVLGCQYRRVSLRGSDRCDRSYWTSCGNHHCSWLETSRSRSIFCRLKMCFESIAMC